MPLLVGLWNKSTPSGKYFDPEPVMGNISKEFGYVNPKAIKGNTNKS